jgi:hypothetical protein
VSVPTRRRPVTGVILQGAILFGDAENGAWSWWQGIGVSVRVEP